MTIRASTDYEDLLRQLNRIQEDAWMEYAELQKQFSAHSDRASQLGVRYVPDAILCSPRTTEDSDVRLHFPLNKAATDAEPATSMPPEPFRVNFEFLRTVTLKWMAFFPFAQVSSFDIDELLELPFTCVTDVERLPHSRRNTEEWTDDKNDRRCELVDKEIEGTISPDEQFELEMLQREMLAHRRKVAPLPLDRVRRIHQELLSDSLKQAD